MASTIGVILFTSLALLVFDASARPDVRALRAALPLDAFGSILLGGVVFTILNASLEEVVFRGVLFDALRSQWGAWITLVGTAVLFGLGHLHGYPSGRMGAFIAGLWGLVMGVLRLWTGGLVMPIVAHMGADATIYWILVRPGAV